VENVGQAPNPSPWRRALVSLLVAIGIVVVAYPEVVLGGGSLSPVGLNGVVNPNAKVGTVQVYPNINVEAVRDGVRDVGARVWQIVPATKFVHRAFAHDESIWWNPYSASGSLGPETLADMKLSPLVLAAGALGASSTAYTFVVLAIAVLALYCLQQLFTRTLGTGRTAAVGACVAFLLMGFAASDFNSGVGAPFMLFPVVLYTLAEFRRVGGSVRFLAAVAAYAGFLLTSFVPIQVLMLVLLQTLAIVIDAQTMPRRDAESNARYAVRLTARSLAVPGAAVALTAYAWLPAVDALRHAGSDISSYSERVLPSSGRLRILKMLSPWLTRRGGLSQSARWVGYVGIVPVLVIATSFPRAARPARRLLAVATGIGVAALALHARLPIVRSIGNLPGLRSVRGDYWSALAGAALAVAVGAGLAVINRRGASRRATTVTALLLAAVVLGALFVNTVASWNVVPVLGVVAALALIGIFTWLARGTRSSSRRRAFTIAIVALMAVELFSYQNHQRLERFDVDSPPPAYVTYLRDHLGDGRILNAGRGGIYPEWGAALGIPQTETLNTVQIPGYRDFYRTYIDPKGQGLFLQIGEPAGAAFAADPSALDALSVRYLVVDPRMTKYDAGVRDRYPLAFDDKAAGIRVYRNDRAFPAAYLSPALAPAAQRPPGTWSMAVTTTDDSRLLADADAAGIGERAANASVGTARVTRSANDGVRVETDASAPAVLVLTDSFYRNWSVTVNGRTQHLGRVNDVVRGVVVPAGHAVVEFHYHSTARTVGGIISIVTAIALVAGALVAGALVAALRRRSSRARKDEELLALQAPQGGDAQVQAGERG